MCKGNCKWKQISSFARIEKKAFVSDKVDKLVECTEVSIKVVSRTELGS